MAERVREGRGFQNVLLVAERGKLSLCQFMQANDRTRLAVNPNETKAKDHPRAANSAEVGSLRLTALMNTSYVPLLLEDFDDEL